MQPTDDSQTTVRGITLVTAPAAEELNEKQEIDYRSHRRDLLKWCFTRGKDPDKRVGYADGTMRVRAGHLDRFYRWVWGERGYTTYVDHDDADAYMEELAFDRPDLKQTTKAKAQKSLKMLFKWRSYVQDGDEWDPEMSFSEPDQRNPRDYLSRDERRRVREAALDLGSIPHYKSVSPEERAKWKRYIATVIAKPLDDVGKDDWKELSGWKETSLVHCSLDAGLRPIEVARAKVDWVDTSNGVLRIPESDSSKSRDNWTVALRSGTADALARWIEERAMYEKYADTDRLWLTRQSNPYSSSSLKTILERVCEEAGIDVEHRDLSWYAIRHSTGTYLAHAEGLGAAKEQLRHKSAATTLKYDQVPIEEREEALDRIG